PCAASRRPSTAPLALSAREVSARSERSSERTFAVQAGKRPSDFGTGRNGRLAASRCRPATARRLGTGPLELPPAPRAVVRDDRPEELDHCSFVDRLALADRDHPARLVALAAG